jgi:hypothetical protein
MSLIKNTAGQNLPFVMMALASATPTTGLTPVGLVSKDGATAATITGTIVSLGSGVYDASLSQADTNGNVLLFLFTATSMVPAAFTIYTHGMDMTGTNIPASVVNDVSVGTMKVHVTVATSGFLSQAFVSTALTSIAKQVWADGNGRTLSQAVTVAAFTTDAITSAAFAADAISRIAGYVWDVTLGDHNAAGTTGEALGNAGTAGDPWATTIPGSYATGTAGNFLGTRIDTTISNIGGGAAPTEVSIWSYATRLLTAPVTIASMGGVHVTVATSGILSQAFVSTALTSIGNQVWAAGTRLLTAGVTVVAMSTHVTVATSGIAPTAFTSTAFTSIAGQVWSTSLPGSFAVSTAGLYMSKLDTSVGNAGSGTAPTEASIWSYTSRLLTAGVTVVEIADGVITSAAWATDGVNRLTNITAIQGVTLAADKLSKSAADMSRGAVDAGSSTVSVVIASVTPSIGIANQLQGAVLIFDHDTTTANLRGQRAVITSNTTGVISTTTLTNAPSAGDTFMVV